VVVIFTDFLTGVLSAIAIFAVWKLAARSKALPAQEGHGKHSPANGHAHANGHANGNGKHRPEHAHSLLAAPRHMRAEVGGNGNGHHLAARDFGTAVTDRRKWLSNIRQSARVARSAFVHEQACVIGHVELGDHVHIAAGASVRADEGSPFFIGANSNIQDGVVIHALKDKYVRVGGDEWAVYVGRHVSMAHDALVHGPCYVGDHTFIGFKAVVHDAVIGARCFIGIGAIVVGVEVPEGKFVPPGSIIDSAEKAAALADAGENHAEFNADVVEVNRGLSAAYHSHRTRQARRNGGPAREATGDDLAYADRF
jgi:carbonic anhydrase/acetyltransferase-like protein (isoleucine patch superfamily)